MADPILLTTAQNEALEKIESRWDHVGPIQPGSGCVMVHVRSDETGCSMWLGIEPDGYTHS